MGKWYGFLFGYMIREAGLSLQTGGRVSTGNGNSVMVSRSETKRVYLQLFAAACEKSIVFHGFVDL